MYILILIALAILFRAAFDILVSRTGGKIDDNLSNTLVNAAATVAAIIPLFYLKTIDVISIPTTPGGVALSIFAGLAVGIFTLFLIKSYQAGGLVYTTPLVYGGTIVLASIAGIVIFQESASFFQLVGIAVILAGMAIVIYAKAVGV